MNLSVPTNFDPELIPRLTAYPVTDVYGKCAADVIGGGRPTGILPNVSLKNVARHVDICRTNGIRFTYLLNASSTGNIEYTRAGQRKLDSLVGRLSDAGVRDWTVATPYLLRYLKSRDPSCRVRISVFAQVGDARKAVQWEEMGADSISLDSLLVNREFDRLAEIRAAVRIRLHLLVNNNCNYGCALSPHHMNTLAAASRTGSATGNLLVDYCYLHCTLLKLRDSAQYLMADWIRPEDIRKYEEIGYSDFKLAGRNLSTDAIVMRVAAYANRRYDGNLLDIVQDFGQPSTAAGPQSRGTGIRGWIRWAWNAAPRRISSLSRLRRLARNRGFFSAPAIPPPAQIDNPSLDGFLDEVIRAGGCRNRICDACGICQRFAAKAVRIDETSRQQIIDDQQALLAELESGSYWV